MAVGSPFHLAWTRSATEFQFARTHAATSRKHSRRLWGRGLSTLCEVRVCVGILSSVARGCLGSAPSCSVAWSAFVALAWRAFAALYPGVALGCPGRRSWEASVVTGHALLGPPPPSDRTGRMLHLGTHTVPTPRQRNPSCLPTKGRDPPRPRDGIHRQSARRRPGSTDHRHDSEDEGRRVRHQIRHGLHLGKRLATTRA